MLAVLALLLLALLQPSLLQTHDSKGQKLPQTPLDYWKRLFSTQSVHQIVPPLSSGHRYRRTRSLHLPERTDLQLVHVKGPNGVPWTVSDKPCLQACVSKNHVMSAIRQMQKLLSTQESSFNQGLRTMKKQLAGLQNEILKQVSKTNVSCPVLSKPVNGRKLGRRTTIGHEVHFLCDPGFQLVGSESRTCQDNRTWNGQQPICKSEGSGPLTRSRAWVTNSSFSRQPRCADSGGSRQCTCDTGYLIKAGGICQDVDECELFQLNRQNRICIHECVNTPGSYRCACPSGYLLNTDVNSCDDVDECTNNQHNCSRSEMCINVYGGFQCVRPECPKPRHNTSYVKTSNYQCERNPCPMDSRSCQLAANSISYHYLTLHSNRPAPKVLFTMSTSHFMGDSLRFGIIGGKGHSNLAVERSDRNTGVLTLISPIPGPATIEVELEMTEMSRSTLLGRHIFHVTIFVSQYDF